MKVPFTYSSTESTVKNVTYSLPWKIPREVDSSIISGLTSTVEDEGVSNQHSDTIWGDLHIIKNKSCKMETDIRRMKHRNQHESLFFYFNEQTWQKKKTKDSLCLVGMYTDIMFWSLITVLQVNILYTV